MHVKYFAQYEAHRKHSINVSVVTISFIITMTSRLERAYYLRLLGLASQTHVVHRPRQRHGIQWYRQWPCRESRMS